MSNRLAAFACIAALVAAPLTAGAADEPPGAAAVDPEGVAPLDDAVTCLARATYFEARGEGETAMRAVAHVVLNRVSDDERPGSVCAVVKEGGPDRPCQFSWWCDGKPDDARELEVYEDALEIALDALKGVSADPTAGATMFHNRRVTPDWARSSEAERTAEIGDHVFYRLN